MGVLRFVALAGAAGLLLSTLACGRGDGPREGDRASGDRRASRPESGRRGPKPASVPVVVTRVAVADMEAFLDSSTTLEAEEDVEVVSQATGVAVEIVAEEGDRVRRDSLLARLAYEDLELAERRARSELERLRADFARAEKLAGQSFISDEDYQRVKFDLARAEIDWQAADLELRRTRIVAPIRGTVTERLVRIGELVRENQVVYRVVDFDSIVAPVYVPEKYLEDVHEGQPAILTAPALGDRRVRGRVKRVSPVVDAQSGTLRLLVDLDTDEALRPGMFANVQLVLDSHEDVLVVPKKALVYEDEQPHAFVVEEGLASRRRLELGYQDEERAEVVRGITADAIVVLVGQSTLKDGSPVTATDESGAPVEVGSSTEAVAAEANPTGTRPAGRGSGS